MELNHELLTQLLVEPGHITRESFDAAQKESANRNVPLTTIIIEKGLMTDDQLGRLLADGYGIPFIDLTAERIERDVLLTIPELVARNQQAIVFKTDDVHVYVATPRPDNYEFLKLLEKKVGKQVVVHYTTALGIKEALHGYKSDLRTRVQELVALLTRDTHNESGIIELVNLILEYAYDNAASDIHIEPLEDASMIRFRIDGILHEVVTYPKALHETVVFRLKIMSRLRIDEQAATQDGRFEYRNDELKFDVRVSIIPATHGENVVMRILAAESNHLNRLEDLGYSAKHLAMIHNAISKPYGMLLSVGPTGSGKSTTLYTLLQMLNRPEVNLMTIEDPVEFNIDHVQQMPVNPKKGVTFATGLRSIVRQDPDIVMVGEIRDAETANIAVNAAMTGHLLLSTLHANDASTTFPRLIDLGVEPFLLASSLNVVIAQRLVRRICDRCRESYLLTDQEQAVIEQSAELKNKVLSLSAGKPLNEIRLYHGVGCEECNHTGYVGRVGIFEVVEITQDLRTLITQKASADVIQAKARELGMESMAADGIEKMFQGITTLSEVVRVTKS